LLRKCLSIFAVTIRHIFSRGCERREFYPPNINQPIVNIFRIFDIFFYLYFKCQIPNCTGISVSDAVGDLTS
jgi:hypothetical protein